MERVGRGSLGVIFFTNSLWDGGEGAPGERVHLDFILFILFFYCGGGGGWRVMFFFGLHLTCGRKKGKG